VTYSVHDGQDLERALRSLRQRVGELADEVEETQSRHRSLDAQVDGMDDRVGALERTQQDLQETQEGLHEGMDELPPIAGHSRFGSTAVI
jgi:chromosome segregation ATPase